MTLGEAQSFGFDVFVSVMPFVTVVAIGLLVLGILHGWIGGP